VFSRTGQPLRRGVNRSYLNRNLLMVRSEFLNSLLKAPNAQPGLWIFLLLAVSAMVLTPAASAQDFTLQASPFSPFAVDPGGNASSNITIAPLNGFTGTVALTCTVAPIQTVGTSPGCLISPDSVTPPGGATATITTTGDVVPALYVITVTGTSPSGPVSVQQDLTVLAVTPQFTITVQTPVAPSSVPAGSGAQGIVTVNPINGYTGVVTLYCSSITPLVTIPPICSFANQQPVTITNGEIGTSTITINTIGPVPNTSIAHPRSRFNALWLSLPMLGLVGLGAATGGKRRRKIWALLGIFVVSGAFMLMPACGGSNNTSTPNGITPNNSYSFTVSGVDTNGVVSGNAGSTSTNPTVTLTVTNPINH